MTLFSSMSRNNSHLSMKDTSFGIFQLAKYAFISHIHVPTTFRQNSNLHDSSIAIKTDVRLKFIFSKQNK